MKQISLFITMVLVLSSCGQIQRVLDGTEKLPADIKKMNAGMEYTSEAIRKQKLSEALKMLKEEQNRANLVPVPLDMMAPARTLAETLTVEETVLFFKNYLIKINTQQSADLVPAVDEEVFQHGRMADYYMLILTAGFLPQQTVEDLVKRESEQGAYQDILMNILFMRAQFNSDMMLLMSMLGLNPNSRSDDGSYPVINAKSKLDTLGKIEKAIEYNTKVEYICNLDFAGKISLEIQDFKIPAFNKDQAKTNWQIILARAESDFKAVSLMNNPTQNEENVKQYAEKYQQLLDQLKEKAK